MALLYCFWGSFCQSLVRKLVANLVCHIMRDVERYAEQLFADSFTGQDLLQSLMGETGNHSIRNLASDESGSSHRSFTQILSDVAYQCVVPFATNLLWVTARRRFL